MMTLATPDGGDQPGTIRTARTGMGARFQRDIERGAARGSPASASASASAWGRPPGWVQPRPTTTPDLTRIAPTAGLGRLSGLPRAARLAAAASQRASSRHGAGGATASVSVGLRLRSLFFGGPFGGGLLLDGIDVHP